MELQDLGLTQEEILDAVVTKVADELLQKHGIETDEETSEEYETTTPTPFTKTLDQLIRDKIDNTVKALADKHILPRIGETIETLVLQKTNQWGEKVGESVTFVEYLTQRAEAYMTEAVNFEGKTQSQNSGYSWNKSGTRIQYMIDKYLQYTVEQWAKNALMLANKSIVEGLNKAIQSKLEEVLNTLRIQATTKS
jgi:hypothetical protein